MAQGCADDYARAAGLYERFRGKVLNESLQYQSVGENGDFWYAVEKTDAPCEYFYVSTNTTPSANASDVASENIDNNVNTSNKNSKASVDVQPLFDVSRLNEGLSQASGKSLVDTSRSSIRELFVAADRTAIWFRAFDQNWKCTLDSYVVTQEEKPAESKESEVRNIRGMRPSPPIDERPPQNSFQTQYELFVRDANLWVRCRENRQEAPLTGDGNSENRYLEDYRFSPDGMKVIVFHEIPEQQHRVVKVESSPQDQLQPKLKEMQYLKPGDRIAQRWPVLFDFTKWMETYHSKQMDKALNDEELARSFEASNVCINIDTMLLNNPWETRLLGWSSDSHECFVLYNQRGHQVMRVLAIDGQTGVVRPIVNEVCSTFFDYAFKEFHEFSPDRTEFLWMSERDGWNHLYRYDVATGTVKNQITQGEWIVQGVDRVDWETRQIWFRCGGIRPQQDPYYTHIARVDLDGKNLKILTEGDGTHEIEWLPGGQYFIDHWSCVDAFPVHELRDAEGRLVRTLVEADGCALLAASWRAPQRFVAKGRDGVTDIYGVIWRPIAYDSAKKYPVIENIYAGPQSFYTPKKFQIHYRTQELAELGFIVVQCDGMGTSGRSKAFHDVCWKHLADGGFLDRKAWITAAATTDPAMDLTRVGIYGGSAGGQNAVAAMLWHHDFYHVAVADCGCHDNRMDKIWWNELWMSWPIGPQYAANSNVTNAHLFEGNLLLFVGELDDNVDPASTMQLVNALIQANKDFDLIVIPGAGHGCAESEYGHRRRMDYFVRHLLRVEPRWKP